jgi:hypothetical protein
MAVNSAPWPLLPKSFCAASCSTSCREASPAFLLRLALQPQTNPDVAAQPLSRARLNQAPPADTPSIAISTLWNYVHLPEGMADLTGSERLPWLVINS